jgi:hypothetical protein
VLMRILRTPDGFEQERLEAANFVPLKGGLL